MMTVNEHLTGLVAMAVAIVAILTVGTLVAADILHLGTRGTAPAPEAEAETSRPGKRSDVVPGPSAQRGAPESRQLADAS